MNADMFSETLRFLELVRQNVIALDSSLNEIRELYDDNSSIFAALEVDRDDLSEIIINYVRITPFIYNKEDPLFDNIERKNEFYTILAQLLEKQFVITITGEDVETRWESLKLYYIKLAKTIADDQEPEWTYYKQLNFLLPYIQSYSDMSALENVEEPKPNNFDEVIAQRQGELSVWNAVLTLFNTALDLIDQTLDNLSLVETQINQIKQQMSFSQFFSIVYTNFLRIHGDQRKMQCLNEIVELIDNYADFPLPIIDAEE